MVTSGIDRQQESPNGSCLQPAIEQAQLAGIQVYAVYTSSEGHFGHAFGRIIWGQDNLAQLAEGEAYFQSFQTPLLSHPFWTRLPIGSSINTKSRFLPKRESKQATNLCNWKLKCLTNADLVAAEKGFVPAVK
jgi:hypothetical protein